VFALACGEDIAYGDAMGLHRKIDLGARRRILACGDVHADFDLFEAKLREMQWDPQQDALVLLGDLVDRGPDPMRALDWISREGVLRIRGNHEEIARLVADRDCDEEWARKCGADWIWDMDRGEAREVADRLMDAPVAITAATPVGRDVGFVHADCPSDWSWVVETLTGPPSRRRDDMVGLCTWSRDHGLKIVEAFAGNGGRGAPSGKVTGIDHLFHGHTIFHRPFIHGDRSWLDTGAYATGRLTMIDVDRWLDDDDKHRIFQ
jgi:serine/threonine protein phosphatase 1